MQTSTVTNGKPFHPSIKWPDLMAQLSIHFGSIYGLYLLFFNNTRFATFVWAVIVLYASGFGITAGAHRLWSHRSYKATWPLRLLLTFLFTAAGQRSIYMWALDHRVHHKFSETEADPHDARRGFIFSHVGWLVLTPHPAVEVQRKNVDMSDLENDPIVMWQHRFYIPLFSLLVVFLPVWVPCYFWNESLLNSFFIAFLLRFCITLNIAFFVNSIAHMWGQKPYDQFISPVENFAVSMAALGEGWHNYHHVFPWDYKTGELGIYSLNVTTGFIDFFAKLGWVFERKTANVELVKRRVQRTGDGSHTLWGWGDKEMTSNDKDMIQTLD